MKTSVLAAGLGVLALAAGAAQAQEVGRVLSSTPVIQQVAVPRQVCTTQQVAVQPQPGTTGAGAVIGGLAGGAIGNQIGHGSGRAAATALGVIGGALLGNNIEGNQAQAAPQVQNVQNCTTQTTYENRTLGYNVRYEYAGKEYQVQLPYDPGPTIRLQVTPVSATETATADVAVADGAALAPAPATSVVAPVPAVVAGAPTVIAPTPVYPAYPGYAYPAWGYGPYYPPVAFSLSLGWTGGGHRHGHGRWR